MLFTIVNSWKYNLQISTSNCVDNNIVNNVILFEPRTTFMSVDLHTSHMFETNQNAIIILISRI